MCIRRYIYTRGVPFHLWSRESGQGVAWRVSLTAHLSKTWLRSTVPAKTDKDHCARLVRDRQLAAASRNAPRAKCLCGDRCACYGYDLRWPPPRPPPGRLGCTPSNLKAAHIALIKSRNSKHLDFGHSAVEKRIFLLSHLNLNHVLLDLIHGQQFHHVSTAGLVQDSLEPRPHRSDDIATAWSE